MKNLKQYLIEKTISEVATKEREIKGSDEELAILAANLKVEKKAMDMQDLKKDLKEDFKYSIQALEDMMVMEQNRNTEFRKGLEMLQYKKVVIESQFSDNELG